MLELSKGGGAGGAEILVVDHRLLPAAKYDSFQDQELYTKTSNTTSIRQNMQFDIWDPAKLKRLIGNKATVADYIRRVDHPHMFRKKGIQQRRMKQVSDIHDNMTGALTKAEGNIKNLEIDNLVK